MGFSGVDSEAVLFGGSKCLARHGTDPIRGGVEPQPPAPHMLRNSAANQQGPLVRAGSCLLGGLTRSDGGNFGLEWVQVASL